jgi:hypothetical protein
MLRLRRPLPPFKNLFSPLINLSTPTTTNIKQHSRRHRNISNDNNNNNSRHHLSHHLQMRRTRNSDDDSSSADAGRPQYFIRNSKNSGY